MNCRQGEIARVVFIHAAIKQVCGRFVRCEKLVDFKGEPAWVLDRRVEFVCTSSFRLNGTLFLEGDEVFFDTLQDKYLRPIRGTDGTDEILRIAGHPLSQSHREKVEAPKPQREFAR